MKTVLRIFGIIIILISLLTCSMSIYRAQLDKDKLADEQTELAEAKNNIDKLKKEAENMTGESKKQIDEQIAGFEKELENIPSETAYLIVQVLLSILLVLSLAFAVFLFRANLKLSSQLFYVAVILTIVAFLVSPDLKRGEYGGMESRTLALLSGIPVAIAGLFAILVAKRTTSK